MFFSNQSYRLFKKRSGFNIASNYSDVLFRVFENSSLEFNKTNQSRNLLTAGFIANNISAVKYSERNTK